MLKPGFRIAIIYGCAMLLASCASSDGRMKKDGAEVHYDLGVSYLNEGNLRGSLHELIKAADKAPRNKEVQNALGLVYLNLEEYDKSINHFNRAISLDEGFSEAYNNMGLVYARKKDYEKAILNFRKAADNVLYETPERAHNNIGMVYFNMKDYNRAMQSFRRAQKLAPAFPLPRFNMGLIHLEKGEFKKAASLFGRIAKDFPSFYEARLKLAETYLRLRRSDLALEEYEALARTANDDQVRYEAERQLELLKPRK